MIDKYTAQASTTEEAIQKGLKALGITKDQANIEVKQEGKKGFLGIGQKDAVVTVKRKNAKPMMEALVAEELSLNNKKETPAETEKQSVVEPVAENPEEVIKAKKENEVKENNAEIDEIPAFEPNDKDKQAINKVAEYLEEIATKMGVEDVTIKVTTEDRKVQFTVDTEDAGLIIGRHGKVLNSLQTLAQIQLHQEADNKLFAKVDAENYRDRRHKTVEQLATRTAEKVKRTSRPVILEPMPAHERKQIHRYLNKFKEVQTHSEGKEPHRYLVVEPAKKEEFKL